MVLLSFLKKIKRSDRKKAILTILILLCLFFSANAFSETKTDSSILTEIILQGTEATYIGDYDNAWKIFESIYNLNADHPSREFYLASVLFWKTNVDPNNPRYDRQIIELLDASINKSEIILDRDPQNIEALHYLGLSYTYWGRLDAHRGRLFAGGTKGEIGRNYLEQAIETCNLQHSEIQIDSETPRQNFCEELYFPLGAYSYFAGRLPKFLKAFNFLWFLPSGSTEEGLAALDRSCKKSTLHSLSAQLLLTSIYALFEKDRLPEALEMSYATISQFPDNPYIDLQHGNILLACEKSYEAFQHADEILIKTIKGVLNYDIGVELQAKLIQAEAHIINNDLNNAILMLNQLSTNTSYLQNTHTAQIYLLLGMAADANGKRDTALRMYDKVLDEEDRRLSRMTKSRARGYKKQPFIIPTT